MLVALERARAPLQSKAVNDQKKQEQDYTNLVTWHMRLGRQGHYTHDDDQPPPRLRRAKAHPDLRMRDSTARAHHTHTRRPKLSLSLRPLSGAPRSAARTRKGEETQKERRVDGGRHPERGVSLAPAKRRRRPCRCRCCHRCPKPPSAKTLDDLMHARFYVGLRTWRDRHRTSWRSRRGRACGSCAASSRPP